MHRLTAEDDDAVVGGLDPRILNEHLGHLEVRFSDQNLGLGGFEIGLGLLDLGVRLGELGRGGLDPSLG